MFDVGIIGLGAMGSATAWSLARQGVRTAGFDQYTAGHDRGSSHGKTRIIRSVYFEGDLYTPLVKAAYTAWERIAEDHGQTFLRITGGLDISLKPGGVFEAALAAARSGGFEHEVLEGREIETRFPALDLGGKARAVWAPDSGLLDSDEASAWMRSEAARLGADLQFDCPVSSWQRARTGFRLQTAHGEIACKKLIVAAGAWTARLLPQLAGRLTPERQVIAWYGATGAHHDALPIFQLETAAAERYYAFPPHRGQGLKFGLYHHRRERGEEAIAPRGIDAEDLACLEAGLDLCLPGVKRQPLQAAECRFTLAPDDRFLIGALPDDPGLILLSPCSGHGYKFAPAIGDIAADLAMENQPEVDISAFGIA